MSSRNGSEKKKSSGEMVQTTFQFSQKTIEMIEDMKEHFGATSKAEVLRKALALLQLAQEAEEKKGSIAVIDQDKSVHDVLIR